MNSGYEQIYASLLPRLAKRNLAENAPRLGAEMTKDGARISFLTREYLITNDGAVPADGKPVSINYRSLLVYYILSDGSGDVSNDFATLNRLTRVVEGQNTLSGDTVPLLMRVFGGDYAKFNAAITRLGGEEQPSPGSGKHVWHLRPLPKILMQFVQYEADDEFPADFQIFFDRTAPKFLDLECLGILTSCTVKSLAEAAGQENSL
ncbi:MAG: DUF3786 domain-containing protein [Synergistaceae bacterium]|jgi:hypothetical protein|nr:DUF3786 domain-containing protein [Synergistaceae bacterium]